MELRNISAEHVKLMNILLVECNFGRIGNATIDSGKINNSINFNVSTQIASDNKNVIIVTEELKFEQTPKDNSAIKEATAVIKYVGVAEISGDYSDEEKIKFGNVNIGAMLYPYIREQLSSFTVKSGLNHVILPPYNFTQIKEEVVKQDA